MTKRILRNLFSLLVSLSLMIGISSCLKDEPEVPDTPDTPEEPDAPIGGFEDFDIFSSVDCDEMIAVEGGTFTMGASSEKELAESSSNELPAHDVCLGDFYIGKYEVTQGLWEYVMTFNGTIADGSKMDAYDGDIWMGIAPSTDYGVGPQIPVYYISRDDIINIFIPRLNKITGKRFRLPTEAEWEYAARGGNKSKGYVYSGGNTIDNIAWYNGNTSASVDYGIHKVGTKSPNELGIYDMSGNVTEWCSDKYGEYMSPTQINPTGPSSGAYVVRRGGAWNSNAKVCRVSNRGYNAPDSHRIDAGFRLVCEKEGENEITSPMSIFYSMVDEMIYIEGGSFMMGADKEVDPDADVYTEVPVHEVTLSDFYIGKYEVTQQLWQYVMNYSGKAADGTIMTASTSSVNDGYDYNYGVGPKYPANKFCYIEIVEIFLPRLNKITGLNYRLLTEAEWEYAARGGQKGKGYKYSGSNTIEDVAWFEENSQTLGNDHPDYGFNEVGTKSPNELGIYDMSGNADEWCGDWFDANYYYTSPSLNPTGPENGYTRVIRGGSWVGDATDCRVSARFHQYVDRRFIIGFRLARSVE